MTGSSLFHDGAGTIYHANGLEAAGCWANLALVVRTSRDSGATWSRPIFANAEQHRFASYLSQIFHNWACNPTNL